ncbi:MAG: hypothetical protein Q7U60_01670, partial [Candidatus Methanoperedens sp.]|nr:hypothetical protein [Candidatus Methanoperedens sp.]
MCKFCTYCRGFLSSSNIGKIIWKTKNFKFETVELKEISVCRDFRHAAEDGKEYEIFKKIQDKNYISDFDKEIKR